MGMATAMATATAALLALLLPVSGTATTSVFLPVSRTATTLDGSATIAYTAKITVGSLPTTFKATLDLEQDFTSIPCSAYESSTYEPLSCSETTCKSYKYSGCNICYAPPAPGCHNGTCGVPGARGSETSELARDTVHFPDGVLLRQNLVACAPLSSSATLGLSSSALAWPRAVTSALNAIPRAALCLPGGSRHPGSLFLGTGPPNQPPRQRTPLLSNSLYTDTYYVHVLDIRVGGSRLPIDTSRLQIRPDGHGGTKLSTVQHYTRLATWLHDELVSAFSAAAAQMNIKRVAAVDPFAACFDEASVPDSPAGPVVPKIELVLPGNGPNVTWTMYGANSMVRVKRGVLCLAFVDAHDYEPFQTVVIGTQQMAETLLVFDLSTTLLEFSSSLLVQGTRCSHLHPVVANARLW